MSIDSPVDRAGDLPTVSILTAAFSPDPAFLLDAYRSVCKQSELHWEWLVQVDGEAPSVLSPEIIGDPRVLVEANGCRLGVAGTRNRGLVRSRAEIVQNLDADDQLLPGALATAAQVLEDDLALAFVFGRTVDLRPDGTRQSMWREQIPFPPGRIEPGQIDGFWLATGGDPLPISPLMWRKVFVYAYGGWAALSVLEDTALVLAVASRHPCHYLDRDTQLAALPGS